jgi:transcriptional regulator with XRE-family HTH domain
MPANTPFAQWLAHWLELNRYTAERLASEMGNTGAMISKWINGHSVPDARNLLKLAEITRESHWHLASVAWDWPAVPQTDELSAEADTREMVKTFEDIKGTTPELAADLLDVARTLRKRARARKRAAQGEASPEVSVDGAA